MEIKELRARRLQLETELARHIDREINSFQRETGISISDILVRMTWVEAIGAVGPSRYIVHDVRCTVDI